MKCRINILFQNTIFRYLFAIAVVKSVFALKVWLIPLTGTGAPLVLFFAAVLVTSLFAGVGPAICAVLLSMPLGAYTFAMGAGYPIVQASFQSLLFAVDGLVAIYLTFLTRRGGRSLQNANRQVRESEEKYRALFDSIDEGFCVVEVLFDDADNPLDYRFLEVNRVFEKQTGIANAVGRRIREIAPAHEEHWFQIYGQIALTGESRRFEHPAHALGRFYDVYAFRLGKPEQRQVAVLFNDITKRKQIEEALQESRTASLSWVWRRAGSGPLIGISVPTRSSGRNSRKPHSPGRREHVAACLMTGSIESARKTGWSARLSIQEVFRENTIAGRRSFEYDPRCRRRKVDRRPKSYFLRCARRTAAHDRRYIDITERKRIEEELKAANASLDAIIENIPLMLFIKDSQSLRFLRFNRAGEDLLGWPKADVYRQERLRFLATGTG